MRIIHIEDFFAPTAGYQINVLAKFQVKLGHDVTIFSSSIKSTEKRFGGFFAGTNIATEDLKYERKFGVRIKRFETLGTFSGRAIHRPSMFRAVFTAKPDLLFVHGNDSIAGMIFTLLSKRAKFPIVFDNHMLQIATQNRFNKLFRAFYRHFFTPIIVKRDLKVIRVQDDPFVVEHLGIPEHNAPLIPLGTDSMNFFPDQAKRNEFRRQLGISDAARVFVYAGKLDASKGGQFLAEALRKEFLVPTNRELVFVIVGNSAGEYGIQFEKLIKESKNRILRFPTQCYEDLPAYYQFSDVALFPKQCSLSFYDTQACGLPAILENNNQLNRERIKSGNGVTYQSDDMEDFRNKISFFANLSSEEFSKFRDSAIDQINKNNMSYDKIILQYEALFESEKIRFL